MINNVSAAILAGGKSRRMGENKCMLKIGNKTLIEHLTQHLSYLFSEIFICTNSNINIKPALIINDEKPDCGPIAGIISALRNCTSKKVFIFSCDNPDPETDLILQMLEYKGSYDALLLNNEHLQPLFGIYTKKCLTVMYDLFQAGIYKIDRAYEHLDIKLFNNFNIKQWNINTKEDYENYLKLQI